MEIDVYVADIPGGDRRVHSFNSVGRCRFDGKSEEHYVASCVATLRRSNFGQQKVDSSEIPVYFTTTHVAGNPPLHNFFGL